MECNEETFKLFSDNKCGLISMDGKEKMVYDTPSGDFIFFYPSRSKMTLNKVVGRDEKNNMPIVRTEINEKEWLEIKDNNELSKIITSITTKWKKKNS